MKPISLFLALLLFWTPPTARAQKPWGYVGVGIVMLCVGTYCTVKIIKLCKKLNPKVSTNAPPEELTFYATGAGDSAGAVWVSATSSCVPDLVEPSVPSLVFVIDATVTLTESGPVLEQAASVKKGEENLSTFSEFQADLLFWGLPFEGQFGEKHFSRNGQPVSEEQSIIKVQDGVMVWGTQGVVVEGSPDLEHWTTIVRMKIVPGIPFGFEDASNAPMVFYRMRLEKL